MSSWATYAVGRRSTRPRAILLALTKISRIDGLPFFPTHCTLRARTLRASAERRYDLIPYMYFRHSPNVFSLFNQEDKLKFIPQNMQKIPHFIPK